MTALITLNPIDPGTDTRVTVRLCATQDPADTGADGQIWWPAIVTQPTIQARLFDGDFTSGVDNGSASVDVRLDVLMRSGAFPRVERYDWAGATVTIQRRNGGSLQTLATMKVDSFGVEAMQLSLRLTASAELFDVDVLSATYAGTGGAEGGADIRGNVKPWVFGRAANVEPVFIDQINNVFQVSGYGPVQAISAAYERSASFGASVGNFATYAALVAATIPPGRWGTCLAQGMIRLGAPPAGVITLDVDGDNGGGFLRRTGAILQEIGNRIGLSANINAASLTALDTAVPRNVNIVIAEQTTFMDLVQRMVAPCNAVPGIGQSGRLLVSRVVFGAEQFTLDAQGREMPPVLGMARQNTSAPYKRIQMGAARSWRVHSFDEIAFSADLIDRGTYDAATVYREGNIVASADKSRWLYINPTASSGNAPPTWPTASNAFWSNLEPPLNPVAIGVAAGATRNTGALNADGLNAVDAGGPLLIGQLPTDKAAPGLQNALVPLGNSNRVPLSRMEGDSGYGVLFNPSGLSGPTDYNSSEGQRFFRVQAMATAAGQQISVGNAPATQPAFRLNPNERISVQARVEAQGAGAAGGTWTLALWGFLPDGTQSLTAVGSVSGSAPRAIGDGHVQFFADVPSNIVGGRLELYGNSGGAGLLQVAISEPMVTSAASGQTVHPPFTPGPNGVDGATRNTGALNADGLNAVDAGGPLLIGQLPPSKADPGLVNTNVPLGSNAVVNSEFTRGKFGWRAGSGTLDSQWGVNLTGTPNWFGQRNVMWMTAPGALAINAARDISPDALWEGGGLPNALQFAMPVVQGNRLAASVLGAQHRCTIQLYILIFDGAGTLISAPVVGGGTPGGAANGDPANFTHLTNFADVPSNGRWAIPMMRMLGTGESDPYIFFTEPMLSKVAAGQLTAPQYTPGRADPRATNGAPNGTPVGGVAAEFLVAQAAQAASDATAANSAAFAANLAIANITSDNILSRDEKPEIRKQRDEIIAEYPTIRARAVALSVSVTNYDSAYDSFAISHPAWDLSGATDTPIDRAAFNAVFTNYYAWRQSVLDGIALEASRRATWGSVTGSGRPEDGSDITRTVSGPADITMQFRADLALLSPLPLTADYQLGVAGASPLTSGVSWSVSVVSGSFTGTAPSIVGSGTGQLRINSALASPEATLRITPSVAGRASPPFVVRVARNVASPSLAPLTSIASSTFAQAHDIPIQITLPSSSSSVSLTAVADLLVNAEAPQGGTTVEGKWQRETSPGTWADVGAPATSSPNPEVFLDEPFPGEFFFTASPGSLTCNRTATGLTPGSIQRFRFVARVSLGNVRTVAFLGNASATA